MYDIKSEAHKLVSQMTLEEKISQMINNSGVIKRLNIPSYNWWNEALHGVARAGLATVFPQAIGLAATFDEKLVYQVADVISTEGRAKYHEFQKENDHDIYKGLTYWSPNVNIFRDPRWGRGHETYGEDPYLTSRLGVAFIKGLQGQNRNMLKSAACAKHFAVHSGPEKERHEFNAECSTYDLWNTYLPAFESAVKEGGVEAIMGAYNRVYGEPCCGSKFLLTDVLRGKWGFDGHVVSDCGAIRDFHEHHKVTATLAESAALAVKNGCDLNCGSMFGYCLAAVQDGLLTEEEIDRSVERLVVTRMRLGLLGAPENPDYVNIPYEVVDCEEHRNLNLEVAKRSLVLLKNNGVLPLNADHIRTIGVIGPNADSRRALEGNYEGTANERFTLLEGIQQYAGQHDMRVLYAEGCHLFKDNVTDIGMIDDRVSEARIVAKRSDVIILCLGTDADLEGEEGDEYNAFAGGDKASLSLPGRQQRLLEETVAAANGKPVVLVLISGSALSVTWADEHVDAIFQAFYPGSLGGLAITQALFGEFSPEGKLPVTFYRSDKDLPDFENYSMENRTYRYFKGTPLYPFGFGLGYSSFSLEKFTVMDKVCNVHICNTGKVAAGETVQIYITSPGQPELRNLCGIQKVFLQPGEEQVVEIELNERAFSRYDKDGNLVLVPGKHIVFAGFCQPDTRSAELYKVKPLSAEVIV